MAGKSKKKFRIIMSSLLSLVLLAGVGANVAMYYYADVITSYFSKIDITTAEAKEARAESEVVAEKISDEGIVLLKNTENMLPMKMNKKVNVFGWSFTSPVYLGSGSGEADASTAVTPKEGLEAAGFEINEQLYNDYVATGIKRPVSGIEGYDWTIPEPVASEFYTEERMKQAKAFSDTAILFIARAGGEGKDLPAVLDGPDTYDPKGSSMGPSGERFGNPDDLDPNKHYLELSNRELGMIDAVMKNFDKVVLVMNGANTFELDWVNNYSQIKSIVTVAGPGQRGFASLGKVLSGQINPSGKTVDLFAVDVLDAPAMANFGDYKYVVDNGNGTYSVAVDKNKVPLTYVNYTEGIYVGYRYYETAAADGAINYDEKVMFPFGHGLSYTTFTQEVVPNSLAWNDKEISVDVKVTNTGSMDGKELVQLYYSAPYTGKIEKSSIELAAFAKTGVIKAGQSETVKLKFNVEDMASYDYAKVFSSTGSYVLEQGEYKLMLMKNSHEKIADVGSKTLAQVVYDKAGRSSDLQVAVNQFDDEVTGQGSIKTYLSRANGFANRDVLNTNKIFKVTTAEGASEEVRGTLVDTAFVDYINSKRYDVPADTRDKPPVTGAKNGKTLEEYVGVDYNDESWNQLLDQLTVSELVSAGTLGGYRTVELASVGKPATVDYDGPAGISALLSKNPMSGIGFPSETMLAQSWNLQLADEMGKAVAKEAMAYNVNGWYAPGINIHRTAFGGRNFEYYSEDAYLSGKMGSAVTQGYQSRGGFVFMKHFALNDQEINRVKGMLTWSNEQAMREIYLKAFEYAVKEGDAHGAMSAFNSIGNTWAGASSALLKDVLRNEWGFKGIVNTDFFINVSYPYMNAELAFRSGNDILLTGVAPHGVPTVNTKSNDTLWALRDSAHNILYTVANSNGMERGMSTDLPQWAIITIIVDILLALAIVLGFYFVFRKRKPAIGEAA
ncbi:glycoside hydrolase family 3 protein [Paenibacillus turpanensis]|uniref:glycoside hydrolase family 3 protein n=1 Tax=Paenibacillus turpanensis TaxID=2689078 RepID=UPI001408369D|nr:glycoside hydrolase family 3 protein [Paenibacillus turpanensis]